MILSSRKWSFGKNTYSSLFLLLGLSFELLGVGLILSVIHLEEVILPSDLDEIVPVLPRIPSFILESENKEKC